jgi:hypothetical protein
MYHIYTYRTEWYAIRMLYSTYMYTVYGKIMVDYVLPAFPFFASTKPKEFWRTHAECRHCRLPSHAHLAH